jgi:hypothetical protein
VGPHLALRLRATGALCTSTPCLHFSGVRH